MKKVFVSTDQDISVGVRPSLSVPDSLTVIISDKYREEAMTAVLPNATGTGLALAVLEAVGTEDGTDEDLAAHYLRTVLEARQRDQKLEALALELCNTYREASEMKQLSSFEGREAVIKRYWLQVAAKALELGASK